jgi:hypothetical protein
VKFSFSLFNFSIKFFFFDLELTEFPKIDVSDEDDNTEITNSLSSFSIDGISLNNNNPNNTSGMSNIQQTSDYESFADCLRQSPMIATATANANIARPLTNINFDDHFSIQSPTRVNAEDLSLSNDQQRRRKNGTSTTTTIIRKNGKTTTNNETPLLSHLLGTHKSNSNSNT